MTRNVRQNHANVFVANITIAPLVKSPVLLEIAPAMCHVSTPSHLTLRHLLLHEALQGHVIAFMVPDHGTHRIHRQIQSLLLALHGDFASETEFLANKYFCSAAFAFASD